MSRDGLLYKLDKSFSENIGENYSIGFFIVLMCMYFYKNLFGLIFWDYLRCKNWMIFIFCKFSKKIRLKTLPGNMTL